MATRRRCDIHDKHRGYVYDGLAERFQEIHYKLYYERSALQAADIYTKAFTILAEWIRACKHINHLDPVMFWGGGGFGDAMKDKRSLGSEHTGGVFLDYWVSNPWHGRDSLKFSTTNETPKPPMTTATATRKEESKGCGDAIESDDISTDFTKHGQTSSQ